MGQLSTIPRELLVEILKYILPMSGEVHIRYTRDKGQSPYQMFRRLSLVSTYISASVTRLFYTTSSFVFLNARLDFPVFLRGLRQTTVYYIHHITFTIGAHGFQTPDVVEAIEAGMDLLWHFTLKGLTIIVPELPRIRQLERLAEYNKVKEVHFISKAEHNSKLSDKLSCIKQVIEVRKARNTRQQRRLEERKLETWQQVVARTSQWYVWKNVAGVPTQTNSERSTNHSE